jgi:hypothetical protein
MRAFITGLPRKVIESLITRFAVAGIIALGLFLWAKSKSGSDVVVAVPAAILIGLTVLAGMFFAFRTRRERQLNGLHTLYVNILYQSLEAFQRNVTDPGELDLVAVVEKGILQPMRDVLKDIYGCDFRLSVLELDASREWCMPVQAGHRLESQRRFRLPYDESFSRFSYESKQIEWANDVDGDPRFTEHPKAEEDRGYEAILSVPILIGDESAAVFNAVATRKNIFQHDHDRTRISLVGSIVNIAWGMRTGGDPPEEALG